MGAEPLPNIPGLTLLSEIGRGGMGVVYLAIQRPGELDRLVAVKVVRPDRSDANMIERFQREATAAAGLRHPSLIQVFDYGVVGDVCFYVMEYIEGPSLADVFNILAPAQRLDWSIDEILGLLCIGGDTAGSLRRSFAGPCTYPRLVVCWMASVARGLHHAHGHQICHRDVKPANILVARDAAVKLADFGLARSADWQAITQPGTIVGSLRYLSPEQVECCAGAQDHRSDVYALGVTLYELLAFSPAFDGQSRTEIIGKILTCYPPDLHALAPAVPRDLSSLCRRAIAKRPEDRFQTASEMADSLEGWLRSFDSPAHGQTATRSRLVMALSVAAVGSALAVAAQLNRNSAAPRSSDVRSNHAALDDGAANVDAGLNDSGAVFASDKAEGDASGQSKARCAPTALVALTEDRNTLEHRQPTTFGGLGENRLRTCLAAQGIRLLDTESGPEVEAARLCEEAARLGGDYLVCGAIEATPTEMASVDIEGLIGRNWIVRLRVAVYSTRPRSKLLFTHTADPVHAVLLGSESCNDDSIARIANSACAEIAARLIRDWRDRRN